MRKEIKDYIDCILQSVLNTHMHEDIRDELNDHIESIVEEKQQQGIKEDDAIKEALLSMGKPKKLGNELNAIYKANTFPIVLMGLLNIFICLFVGYMTLAIALYRIIDYIVLFFALLLIIGTIFYYIKIALILNNALKDTIYYTQPKSHKDKSYIENFTNKIFFIGFSLFLVLMFSLLVAGIVLKGFSGFFTDNPVLILQLTTNANLFFMIFLNKKYPQLILTNQGVYKFDLPEVIPWHDIHCHKWIGSPGRYRLDLYEGDKNKKIYGDFKSYDKIIIDNLLKKYQNSI